VKTPQPASGRKTTPDAVICSNTVRVHRKLRAAGVEAVLQVWEGQSHAQYNRDITAPETKEYNEELARFFDLHLGR
jgi:acetyl esterase/lipase